MKNVLLVLMTAAALSALFFDPLWRGGGFVGGDVYSYYFPQKTWYADCLARGELPLWNPLVAHGYPVLGESQTGVFYPPNVVLYRLLDVNTAYHVNHLLHYILAYAFTVLLARRLGLSGVAAGLAGVVYVYGWFPARSCWEWAIIGGAWLPLAVWLADRLMSSGRWCDAVGLAVVLAVQMLPGHEHIAFLTQLVVAGWMLARLAERRTTDETGAAIPGLSRRILLATVALAGGFLLAAVQLAPMVELLRRSQRSELGETHNPSRGLLPWQNFTMLAGWVRTTDEAGENTSWEPWCSPLVDHNDVLQKNSPSAPTNKTEAGLYFGVVPLGLALLGGVSAVRGRRRVGLVWMAFGLLSALYATGILVPFMQLLPGFGWFHGPGRYGLITTLAVALLAGFGLDTLTFAATKAARPPDTGKSHPRSHRGWLSLGFLGVWLAFAFLTISAVSAAVEHSGELTRTPSPLVLFGLTISDGVILVAITAAVVGTIVGLGLMARDPSPDAGYRRSGSSVFIAVVMGTTLIDLWMASRLLTYSPMVADPPIKHVAESPVLDYLHHDSRVDREAVRLQAPGGNLPSILGVPSTPAYFTFGPQEYARQDALPELVPGVPKPDKVAAAHAEWERAGVTHVMSFFQLDPAWGLELIWSGRDPFLNPAWGMFRESLFLYRIANAEGRVQWVRNSFGTEAKGSNVETRETLHITRASANSVEIEAESTTGGRVVLTDLMYPGWQVRIDGTPAEPIRGESKFRVVEVPAGKHVIAWTFHPSSVYWGGAVSAVSVLLLSFVAWRAGRAMPMTPQAVVAAKPGTTPTH